MVAGLTGSQKQAKGGSHPPEPGVSTNLPVRRETEPRLRSHKKNGKNYYYYCRGKFEEYLGSPDFIRQCVRAVKAQGG